MIKFASILFFLFSSAGADFVKVSSQGNGIYVDITIIPIGIALHQSSAGDAAIVAANYNIFDPNKRDIYLSCLEYIYQGEMNDSFIFTLNHKSILLSDDARTRAVADIILNAKLSEEKAADATTYCPLLGKIDSSLQIFVPIRTSSLYLAGLYSGAQINLTRVVGTGISAQIK